ncbi:hypothetical protein HBI81_052490 [Parastagonospora nodorum]|nr:hypothetical protein HBI10_106110 [Parastagonospora nodorum]KAH4009980.1 hypothetical protein HBI13_212560 [Parastagonospora nodorum]KAH4904752.1 hypothetical protein HBH74_179190 [Parastagonospora nodorum]KAH4991115.1 hypothetical protein HBH73_018980 [Parastagonospora nodorum]KAH5033177.1 hypothetical protein HBI75_101800 [Parastagonospora nodorum]
MADARKLAPRPPGAVHPYASASSSRRAKVSIACESCRLRRVKCDGVKPKCRSCRTQATDCVYATPTNHLAEQQKVKIEKLESDKSALYEILWYLQTKNPEQATALLEYLRCNPGDDVGATLQHFTEYRQGLSDMNVVSESEANSSRSISTPSASYNTEPLDLARVFDDRILVQPETVASLSTRTSYATVLDLNEPIDWFFNCVGALFYIMDKDVAQRSIESIKDFHMPLGDLVTMNVDARTTTTAAELAGMAAVGVVHSRLAEPDAARPAELADYFYAVAKLGLDVAIEYNPLRAVKICALVAMYNIIVHASVALAYLDLGISLSRRFGIDASEQNPTLSPVDYDDMWRTYRTLVHLQCWLSASLDSVPIALGPAALEVKEDTGVAPEDMIRRECVKVTIIKAEMLHQVPETAPVPGNVVANFQQRFRTFVEQLPDWMGLLQLISNEQREHTLQFRPVIFYVHLFYHSARMLLSRRLAIAYIPLDATSKVLLPVEVHKAIRDGLLAARNNAVLMESMLFEGKIVQVCWLCM